MNKDCYSGGMAPSPIAIEYSINRLRIQQKMRVLWPDYEVHDLIQAGVAIQDLARFTSSPLSIHKIAKPEELFEDPSLYRHFTHMVVHKISQLDDDLRKVNRYFVVLSKRGLAVDELNSKFIRGSYIISAHVAQVEKQICLWGVESVSEGTHIISPKYISKCNGMWRVEFQSEKSVRNIMLYSTRREPRYGKGTTYGNELPKDAKLELCMKFRIFQSFVEGAMAKEEEKIFENVQPFISPRKSQVIFFNSQKEKQVKIESEVKIKNEQNLINHFRNMESSSPNKEIRLKILQNSSVLEVNRMSNQDIICDIGQIKQFIEIRQKIIYQPAKINLAINQSLQTPPSRLNFSQALSSDEEQIERLIKAAKQLNQNDILEYLIAIKIHAFAESHQKTIQYWIQLYELTDILHESQTKLRIIKWMESLMIHSCLQLLKDCDQDQLESFERHKALIIQGIIWSLESNSHQSSKICDLLYILMKIQGKKDIFDLYHSHQHTDNSVIITSSLKQLQQKLHLYPKNDTDVIYQTEVAIQLIQYRPCRPSRTEQVIKDKLYDFVLTFSYGNFSNNAFLSGRQFSVDNHRFKYFITRSQGNVYCFIQKIEPLNPSTSQQVFTSFEILFEMTINSNKQIQVFQWSFISPPHSVGSRFYFKEVDGEANIQCKILFKRAVIHDSILNYLRVRYEQLLKIHNKCSDKIETQNKKLLKRRSSLFLQRNLYDDVNFGNTIDQECFLHHICEKCEVLSQESSIYKLSPLDLYQLMLSAPFKDEVTAFLVTIKYLIITPDQIINKQFWLSQLRIKHLNLRPLLRLVNKKRLDKDLLQIIGSLIQQKIRANGPKSEKVQKKVSFIAKVESRVGKNMWEGDEADYSAEYLQFLDNVYKRL